MQGPLRCLLRFCLVLGVLGQVWEGSGSRMGGELKTKKTPTAKARAFKAAMQAGRTASLGGGAAAARRDAILGVSGQRCVNQSAPIAGLFGAAVAVGAGPGATFLRAESVFASRQLPFGDTPSSGFDALLTAVEWLESPGPVPHQLMSAFSSTATSQPESSPLMQGNLPLMHFS
ncbi:hypothetical protein T484DRAFT_1972343, partial [Baffinella frigidus]